MYEKNWSTKNIDQLKKKIRLCLSKIDMNLVQKTLGSVRKRLDTRYSSAIWIRSRIAKRLAKSSVVPV